jgi:hypothetical protein
MALFGMKFFRSKNEDINDLYIAGTKAIQMGDFAQADTMLRQAALGDHVSALYNLAILNGSGMVSPYDPDFAAECVYKASAAGHPGAQSARKALEAADRVQLAPISDMLFMPQAPPHGGLNALVMVTACRYFSGFCTKLEAGRDVIAYELDGASSSEIPAVQRFIERTGLDSSFYEGGMDSIVPGSPADMATNGLNELGVAMMMSGFKNEICAMARCTVVGYIIRKSPFGSRSGPLLGVRDFFS